eukprot:357125-Chlamydomonas_euryale.AAC.1
MPPLAPHALRRTDGICPAAHLLVMLPQPLHDVENVGEMFHKQRHIVFVGLHRVVKPAKACGAGLEDERPHRVHFFIFGCCAEAVRRDHVPAQAGPCERAAHRKPPRMACVAARM